MLCGFGVMRVDNRRMRTRGWSAIPAMSGRARTVPLALACGQRLAEERDVGIDRSRGNGLVGKGTRR